MAAPTLLGAPLTVGGLNVLENSTSGDRSFAGKGNTAQSNRMQGSVTVTVMQRLPNGNLVIQGQKQLRLTQGDELVQVQGIVRAADIARTTPCPPARWRCPHRLRRPRCDCTVQCDGLAEPLLQFPSVALLSLRP